MFVRMRMLQEYCIGCTKELHGVAVIGKTSRHGLLCKYGDGGGDDAAGKAQQGL
jgi:hypothetical protein